MNGDPGAILYAASTWIIPVLLAITLHEAAHGWVALKLGDDTAAKQGRVTFNPLRHIDLFGTILLPGLLIVAGAPFVFGYAKPVPVNFARLRRPKRDMALVAGAGPGINLLLAALGALLLHASSLFPAGFAGWWQEMLTKGVVFNVMIGTFNLVPIPPLDGGRIVTGLLPMPLARRFARLERFGMMGLLFLLVVLPLIGQQIGVSLNPLGWILLPIVNAILWLLTVIFQLN